MFDLALKLGKTVGEIQQMPAAELQEWKVYSRILTEEAANADLDNKAQLQMLNAKHKRRGK